MDASAGSNEYSMNGTVQRALGGREPNPSRKDRARPQSGERLSSHKVPANTGPGLSTPPSQPIDWAKKGHSDFQIDAKGFAPTNWISLSTEYSPTQHRGRSHMRHRPRSRTMSCATSKSRFHSPVGVAGLKYSTDPIRLLGMDGAVQSTPSQQSSETNPAGFVAQRPRPSCRFSYEDYKHNLMMEWLERGVACKEVIKTFVPILSSASDCDSRNEDA
jgi:hypothetical protein